MSDRWSQETLRDTRGVSIVLMAITIVATMSAVALAIDIGMLLNARTEAQRAADASALAGAAALITDPDDSAGEATALAIEYGARNTVMDIPVVVLPEDVDVDLARARVTVTVRRISARGTAVPTWFANVFGVSEVDVEARAAAEAVPTGSARCLKPFAIPDAFDDANGNGIFDAGDDYVAADHGYGSDWRNPGNFGDDGLNYENDFGRPMNVKQGGPSDPPQPGWYYPWDIPQVDGSPAVGGDKYRWNIGNCNPSVITIGDEYWIENGNMLGPTNQGVEELIGQDSGAYWNPDPGVNSVEGSSFDPWYGSPRVGIVPVFDPSRPFDPGKQPIVFTNFIAMWFEGVVGTGQDQEVQVHIMYAFGIPGGDESAAGKMVVLVE
jgi:Flp pilus assembly protein TadG